MKITVIVLQSLDGIIACDHNDKLHWGSKADKQFFRNKVAEIGTMILGSATFKTMPQEYYRNVKQFVLTSKPEQMPDLENVTYSNNTAQQLITQMEQEGIKEAALVGGANVINQFLQANLVSELYVTIAPYIFVEGIRGYGTEKLICKLQLLNTTSITEQEILLHYKVIV